MENIGKKFNKLTVISVETKTYEKGNKQRFYTCLCDCGNIIKRSKYRVTRNETKSCGCIGKYKDVKIFPNHVEVTPNSRDCTVLLDLDDWEYFKNYKMHIHSAGYAMYTMEKQPRYVHRKIMNNPKEKVVDHINRNKLDNRKCNLRLCSKLENFRNVGITAKNKSGYKGVCWEKKGKKWAADIKFGSKITHLGRFSKLEDAVRAREVAELKYFGEFARQEIINKGNYKMNRNKFSSISFDQYKKDNIRELITNEELRKEYDDLILPKRATDRSAGYDFASPFSFTLKPGDSILIPSGIHMELEKYMYLQLAPRSSLGFKYRLQFDNINPIIDSDYFLALNEGHIMLKMSNCSFDEDNILTIKKGDRICQGIISQFYLMDDDDLDYKQTRIGGIGSTNAGATA